MLKAWVTRELWSSEFGSARSMPTPLTTHWQTTLQLQFSKYSPLRCHCSGMRTSLSLVLVQRRFRFLHPAFWAVQRLEPELTVESVRISGAQQPAPHGQKARVSHDRPQ